MALNWITYTFRIGSNGNIAGVSSIADPAAQVVPVNGVAVPRTVLLSEQIAALKNAPLRPAKPIYYDRVPDSIGVLTGWRAWRVFDWTHGVGALTAKNNALDRASPSPFRYSLQSLGQPTIWPPMEAMLAACLAKRMLIANSVEEQPHREPAPNMHCLCGMWAFKSLEELQHAIYAAGGYETAIIGQVNMWGRVVESTYGFRAEFAYPKELWMMHPEFNCLGELYRVPFRSTPRGVFA